MNGRDQVIVNGWKHIGGYDLETGKEVWRMTGGGDIPVPTPITGHGLVFITNAHGKLSPIYAIRPTATGDISLKEGETSNAHIAWSYARDGAYMQTPILYGDILYVCRDNGVLSAFDATTGKRHYQVRLGQRVDGLLGLGGGRGGAHLLHQRGRRRLRRQGRPARSSCWPPTRWARSRWPRRPSPTVRSSSARAITWWRSATR